MEGRFKLDIEQLSEARWSRIERATFDKLAREEDAAPLPLVPIAPAREKRVIWRAGAALVMAGAAAAAVGAFAWSALSPKAAPNVVTLAPSRIATEGSTSQISVGESTIELGPHALAWVSGDDARGVSVLLDHGGVECDVPPRLERPPFLVHAGDVTVRVVGTHFKVAREGQYATVEVAHGQVEVTYTGGRAMVRSGERWSEATVSTVPAATAAPAVTAAATTEPPRAPSREREAEPPAQIVHPAPEPRAKIAAPKASAPRATARPTATATEPPAPPPPSARDQYESATRAEASEPGTAIATYKSLAAKGGAWGMNALFAQARLEADRGNAGEARRLLNEYLARYPSGPNASDARRLLERIK